jgi:hypothetical protein
VCGHRAGGAGAEPGAGGAGVELGARGAGAEPRVRGGRAARDGRHRAPAQGPGGVERGGRVRRAWAEAVTFGASSPRASGGSAQGLLPRGQAATALEASFPVGEQRRRQDLLPYGLGLAVRSSTGGGPARAAEGAAPVRAGLGPRGGRGGGYGAAQVRRMVQDRWLARLDSAGACAYEETDHARAGWEPVVREQSGSSAQGLRPGAAASRGAAQACRPCFSSTRAWAEEAQPVSRRTLRFAEESA